jgi:hypothetical protein
MHTAITNGLFAFIVRTRYQNGPPVSSTRFG